MKVLEGEPSLSVVPTASLLGSADGVRHPIVVKIVWVNRVKLPNSLSCYCY